MEWGSKGRDRGGGEEYVSEGSDGGGEGWGREGRDSGPQLLLWRVDYNRAARVRARAAVATARDDLQPTQVGRIYYIDNHLMAVTSQLIAGM